MTQEHLNDYGNEEMATEVVLEELFTTFCYNLAIDGKATIKDIFYSGVIAASIVLSDRLTESTDAALDELDCIIGAMSANDEIDTSYILSSFDTDDSTEEEGSDDFDSVES
jgi:hypothetical protein